MRTTHTSLLQRIVLYTFPRLFDLSQSPNPGSTTIGQVHAQGKTTFTL